MKELNKILSTLQELRSVIRTLRLNPSEADLREMIKELYTNSKYSAGVRECHRDTGQNPSAEDLREMIKQLDTKFCRS